MLWKIAVPLNLANGNNARDRGMDGRLRKEMRISHPTGDDVSWVFLQRRDNKIVFPLDPPAQRIESESPHGQQQLAVEVVVAWSVGVGGG